MRLSHHLMGVGTQGFADEQVFLQDFVGLLAKRPQLVICAGVLAAGAVLGNDVREGLAIAVHAHDRAVGSPLEPTDQQLVEVLVRGFAAMEAADVGGPPRDARDAHVQPGAYLHAEEFPVAADVAAPHQGTVALAAGPGAAHQVDGVFHALGPHAFIEAPGE